MTGPEFVDATFYAQVEPRFLYGTYVVTDAAVKRVTQTRPNRPGPGCVVVKLTVRVPVTVFKPLEPEGIVVIPENLTDPIEVTVDDPKEPVSEEA
jgi:hypothetical protein